MSELTMSERLKKYVEADIPVILWGAPGTGKTAIVEEAAGEAKAHLETLILSQLDPVDLIGLPVTYGGQVIFAPPAWAQRLRNALDGKKEAWLFLDEVSCASPALQAAALRLIHARMIGDIDLSGIRILAAANPSDTAADGGWLAPATANRFAHISYRPDLNAWITGELVGWGKPASMAVAAARAKICAFLKKNPKNFCTPPTGDNQQGGNNSWPSPRSWSAVSRLLATGVPTAEAASLVGEGVVAELATYLATNDLPDPEDVLAGRADLPARGDQLYAASIALAGAAVANHPARAERIKTAWSILGGLRADTALSAAKILREGAPELVGETGFKLSEKIMAVSG